MNQREKIMVAGGTLIVVAVLGWRILLSGGTAAATGDAATIPGAINAIHSAATTRAAVLSLASELAVAIPQGTATEQEAAIRADLGQKAQAQGIQMLSQKGVKSQARGGAQAVQSVQYRLEMYGQFDAFMKLIAALEQSPTPYIIREVNFESTLRAPGENRPGGPQGGMPGGMPGGGMGMQGGFSINSFSGGGGGGGQQPPPTGKVNVTMKIQSYLFPAETAGARGGAPGRGGTGQITAVPARATQIPTPERRP